MHRYPMLNSASAVSGTSLSTVSFGCWCVAIASSRLVDIGGRGNIRLPNEIIWLMGSPGSGKGTNTPAVLKARGITNAPIVMSRLLQSPEIRKQMDRGEMICNSLVICLMLICDS